MYSTTIKKVNRFGKIGNIIVTILMVLSIIGMIAVTAATIYLGTVPRDAITVSVSSNVKINVDEDLFDTLWGSLVDGFSYTTSEGIISTSPAEDTEMQIKVSLSNSDYSSATIHSDGNRKTIDASTDQFVYELKDLIATLISGLVFLASVIASLFMLKKLFKGFEKCESPFSDDIVKKMHFFSLSLIPVALLSSFAETLTRSLLTASQDISIYVDWGIVIAFIVAKCLGTVFKYGVQLQRESDETL